MLINISQFKSSKGKRIQTRQLLYNRPLLRSAGVAQPLLGSSTAYNLYSYNLSWGIPQGGVGPLLGYTTGLNLSWDSRSPYSVSVPVLNFARVTTPPLYPAWSSFNSQLRLCGASFTLCNGRVGKTGL